MKSKIKIVCLPKELNNPNPYQNLLINGLKKNPGLEVISGNASKKIGILTSALYHKPHYIHFDWINKYYSKRFSLESYIYTLWFFIQIFIIKKILKINIVWTLHNIFPHDTKNIKLHRFVQYQFSKQCKWIRVFSNNTVNKLIHEFNFNKNKLIVVPEGSYVNYYPNFISKEEARKELNIQKKEKIFLYFGAIKPYKGLDFLIEEISNSKHHKIKLIIVGRTPKKRYLNKIKEKIKNNDSITLENKYIKDEQIQIYFKAADIIVLPFENIENSGSIILAMGFKKVIIAPNIGVIPDRLNNQKKFLYSENIIEKFELALKTSDKEIEILGNKNFEELKKYTWKDFGKYFTK